MAEPSDTIAPEQALKDPFVLEFLNLKDEYSESDLEDALIQHLADNEAHYALEGLPNKVMAAEYQTVLPDAKLLEAELDKTRRELEGERMA